MGRGDFCFEIIDDDYSSLCLLSLSLSLCFICVCVCVFYVCVFCVCVCVCVCVINGVPAEMAKVRSCYALLLDDSHAGNLV